MSIASAFNPGLTAMQAFGLSLQNTAHNLANSQTEGFKAGRLSYADLPHLSGVQAQGPTADPRPGALVPYGPGLPESLTGGNAPPGFIEGSNTDIPTEIVNLIVSSRTYQANARSIRTADEMLGVVVNLRV